MAGGGGSTPTTTTTEIDPTLRPYVTYGLGEAKSLYQSENPSFYPGQTYVSPSAVTQNALQAAQQRATSGSHESLSMQSLLMDFLAALQQKLWMESRALPPIFTIRNLELQSQEPN